MVTRNRRIHIPPRRPQSPRSVASRAPAGPSAPSPSVSRTREGGSSPTPSAGGIGTSGKAASSSCTKAARMPSMNGAGITGTIVSSRRNPRIGPTRNVGRIRSRAGSMKSFGITMDLRGASRRSRRCRRGRRRARQGRAAGSRGRRTPRPAQDERCVIGRVFWTPALVTIWFSTASSAACRLGGANRSSAGVAPVTKHPSTPSSGRVTSPIRTRSTGSDDASAMVERAGPQLRDGRVGCLERHPRAQHDDGLAEQSHAAVRVLDARLERRANRVEHAQHRGETGFVPTGSPSALRATARRARRRDGATSHS